MHAAASRSDSPRSPSSAARTWSRGVEEHACSNRGGHVGRVHGGAHRLQDVLAVRAHAVVSMDIDQMQFRCHRIFLDTCVPPRLYAPLHSSDEVCAGDRAERRGPPGSVRVLAALTRRRLFFQSRQHALQARRDFLRQSAGTCVRGRVGAAHTRDGPTMHVAIRGALTTRSCLSSAPRIFSMSLPVL